MKKRVFSIVAVLIAVLPLSVSAKTYTDKYPDYVNISGGAYCEIQSAAFQRCTLVFPYNFKDGTFGFVGSGSDICNITNSSVSGILYTEYGESFSVRANRFGVIEYQVNVYPNIWLAVDISDIYNTNINFIDDLNDRQTDNYSFDKYQILETILILSLLAVSIIRLFIDLVRGGKEW